MSESKTQITITKSLAMNRKNAGAVIGIKGTLLGKIIRLEDDVPVFLGKDEEKCRIVIPGDKVSRVHCSIRYNSAGRDYTVTDLSTNGTVADKKYKLKKGAEVKALPGTTLWIGSTDNEIRLG